MKKQIKGSQTFCQIGTTGKGMPCLTNINTLAGLTEPCEVCAPYIQKMRDQMEWVPFRGRFYMSNKLADFQHDSLLGRINAACEEKAIEALIAMGLHPNSEEIQEKVLTKLRDNE